MSNKKKVNLQKINNVIKFFLQTKELLFSVIIIIATLLNLYATVKLAPITQDISVLQSKVLANETCIKGIGENIKSLETKIDSVFDKLDKKIDNIYTILINR